MKKLAVALLASLAIAPVSAKTSLQIASLLPGATYVPSFPLFTQTYTYTDPGFVRMNRLALKPVSLPGLGTFESSFTNGGSGDTAVHNFSFSNSDSSTAKSEPRFRINDSFGGVSF